MRITSVGHEAFAVLCVCATGMQHARIARKRPRLHPGLLSLLSPGAQQTEDDMRHSLLCVCPPGNTQDSARVWRAIILGCIPVTFFRANDLPFGRHIGMPYRDFMLNIQPDDYHQLNKRVAHLVDSPGRLRRMQEVIPPQTLKIIGPDLALRPCVCVHRNISKTPQRHVVG